MRTLMLAAAITLLPFTVSAEKAEQSQCEKISSLAGSVMILRQLGEPMAKMYKLANKNKLIEAMVIEAYETPRFTTDKAKDEYIGKFKDT